MIKDFEYVIDSYPSMDKVVTDVLQQKTSSSFVQIRTIQTFIQDELRYWPVELVIEGNDLLVAYLKVKPIHCEMI